MTTQHREHATLQGTHKARAKEWALGLSQTGKEQIAVLFEITSGPHAGKSITWFGYFTDQTVDRTLESLRHCGWDSDSLADLDGLGENEVVLVVEDETYEGKTRSRVKWVNRESRLALKDQMSAAQVQAFAARMRGKTVASKQKYGAQPQPDRSRARQGSFDAPDFGPPQDDDIPF